MIEGLVSIVTPCYNGEKYLEKYFKSLYMQTYSKIEIIIVDDESTDKTKEIILFYQKKLQERDICVKYVWQKHAGQAAAINSAMPYVEGEFFVWCDCDDYFETDAIEVMNKFLHQHKEYQFVRSNVCYCTKNRGTIESLIKKPKYSEKADVFTDYLLEKDSYIWIGAYMARMTFWKSCIPVGGIYEGKSGQNFQILLPMAYYGKCGYIDKVTYNYMIHENSHSHNLKGTKQIIARFDEHRNTINQVLSTLEMDQKQLVYYHKLLDEKYRRIKIRCRINHLVLFIIGETGYKMLKRLLKKTN